jgi:hypothetical protein
MTEVLDIAPALVWMAALTSIIAFGSTVWSLMTSPAKRNGEHIGVLFKQTEALELRVAAIEQAQAQLPTKDDMHVLHLGMAEMRGDVRVMSAAMEGNMKVMQRLENIVSRHEEHLLGAKR